MSYTVVIDERERERRFVNLINKSVRHCRIGNVREKIRPEHLFTGLGGIGSPARPKHETFFIVPFDQPSTLSNA